MKKCITIILAIISILSLTACGSRGQEIKITIPAGSQAAYVYSDEEISPTGNSIKISAGAGYVGADVILKSVEVKKEIAYEPVYLSQDSSVKLEAEKGGWFKIGVAMQSVSEVDITVCVEVKGVDVRIP